MSGRRITTISLDDESYHQSKHIGNLSAFVRNKLLEEATLRSKQPVDYHNAMHPRTGYCHPHKALDGYCTICWPYGQPTPNEYNEWIRAWFNEPNSMKKPKPPRQLPDRRNNPHAETIAQEKSSQAISQKVGIIRKIWRFIF